MAKTTCGITHRPKRRPVNDTFDLNKQKTEVYAVMAETLKDALSGDQKRLDLRDITR